jgi:hypothetical protein
VRPAPLYHRLLRLRSYRPGALMTAILFEGSIAVSAVLALAEILDWWAVLAIPITVAAMVKFNDVVAGLAHRPASRDVARRPPHRRLPRDVAGPPSASARSNGSRSR